MHGVGVQKNSREVLPLQGSNLDSSAPEADVLPVTPRGIAMRRMITLIFAVDARMKIVDGGTAFNPRTVASASLELVLPITIQRSRHARLPLSTRAFAATALLTIAAGCRDGFNAFGSGPRARTSADQLLGSLADRHTEVARNAKYEYARVRMMRGALAPSRVFDDSAVWTGLSSNVRVLETFGSLVDGRYLLAARPHPPAPSRPADGRHRTMLTRLNEGEYQWEAAVDFALGSVRPVDVAALVTRILASGEGRTETQLRAELASLSPRGSAALGTLFTLDSLHPVTLVDGSTITTLGASIHSENLRRRFPSFAEYAHRYLDPARYRFVLTDRAGTPYLEASQKDRVIMIRLRTLRGRLVSLGGSARALPDSLQLHADFNVKVKIFRVGFHELVMDFVNAAHGDDERTWTVTARKEPRWDLPFITARLLRAPLRRPFSGEGSSFSIGVRAGESGSPTILRRHSRLPVQESAILNFLNSLSGTAMDDFGSIVQKEENAWLRELFAGVREDARAVTGVP